MQRWDEPMMFGGFEDAVPVQARGQKWSQVGGVGASAARDKQLELGIEAVACRSVSQFDLSSCGQNKCSCGLSMSLREFCFRKVRVLSIESSNSGAQSESACA